MEYQKNLNFVNLPKSIPYRFSEASRSGVNFENPPLSVYLDSNARARILSVGPLLPFPIVPWIPGIVDVTMHADKFQLPKNNLRIRLVFRRLGKTRNEAGSPSEFVFSAKDAKLFAMNEVFLPLDPVICESEDFPGITSIKLPDGKHAISIAATSPAESSLYCDLIYDIATNSIVTASLEIKNLIFNGKEWNVLMPIRQGRSTRMRYIGP